MYITAPLLLQCLKRELLIPTVWNWTIQRQHKISPKETTLAKFIMHIETDIRVSIYTPKGCMRYRKCKHKYGHDSNEQTKRLLQEVE